MDEDYPELLNLPHFSHDSRLLNAALAMGTQGVYPSRAMGGMGFHEQYYAHLALYGKTYLALYQVGTNNAWDSYLLTESCWWMALPMTWAWAMRRRPPSTSSSRLSR